MRQTHEILTSLSNEDYAPAQAFLGWLYQCGKGVPVDTDRARRFYEAAADSGYSVGEFYLGLLDVQEARHTEGAAWLQKAAGQGYAPAWYRLGWLYQKGLGVPASRDEAYRCWEQAAALGHLFAQRQTALEMIKGCAGAAGVVRGLWRFVCIPLRAVKVVITNPDSEMLHE